VEPARTEWDWAGNQDVSYTTNSAIDVWSDDKNRSRPGRRFFSDEEEGGISMSQIPADLLAFMETLKPAEGVNPADLLTKYNLDERQSTASWGCA
jgi:hypothetical protein